MRRTSVLTKLSAAAAALAAPALLLLGAGTAQADLVLPPGVQPQLDVWGLPAPGGVEVQIHAMGMSGWCTYTSAVQGNPVGKPAPALGIPFYLQPPSDGALWSVSRLWFPSYPTGSTWNTTVSCPNGVASRQTFW